MTAFSQADGFLAIDALASALDAGSECDVTLIGDDAKAPDLVIMGSHDIALDVVVGALAERGFHARTIAVGSQGGVSAASRGECDIAPVHLVDPATGIYNKHLLAPGLCARARMAADAGLRLPQRRSALRGQERGGGIADRARRCFGADGQSQCRLRHARSGR